MQGQRSHRNSCMGTARMVLLQQGRGSLLAVRGEGRAGHALHVTTTASGGCHACVTSLTPPPHPTHVRMHFIPRQPCRRNTTTPSSAWPSQPRSKTSRSRAAKPSRHTWRARSAVSAAREPPVPPPGSRCIRPPRLCARPPPSAPNPRPTTQHPFTARARLSSAPGRSTTPGAPRLRAADPVRESQRSRRPGATARAPRSTPPRSSSQR